MKVSAYNTNEKVYVQNDETGECIARLCKISMEVFGKEHCYYYKITNPTTKRHWYLFKEKVKKYYNFNLNDKYYNNAIYLKNKINHTIR